MGTFVFQEQNSALESEHSDMIGETMKQMLALETTRCVEGKPQLIRTVSDNRGRSRRGRPKGRG